MLSADTHDPSREVALATIEGWQQRGRLRFIHLPLLLRLHLCDNGDPYFTARASINFQMLSTIIRSAKLSRFTGPVLPLDYVRLFPSLLNDFPLS